MEVWKFTLNGEVSIPRGFKILDIQLQNDVLTMWALGNPDNPLEIRKFVFVGTGQDIDVNHYDYIKTFQQGSFVWHIFEEFD